MALLALAISFKVFKPSPLTLQNNYPVRFAFLYTNPYTSGDDIVKGWGLPGYAPPHIYNYLGFTFWTCASGASESDAPLKVWRDASMYFGDNSRFGKDTEQIQKNIKNIYNQNGIKILVTAFGDA